MINILDKRPLTPKIITIYYLTAVSSLYYSTLACPCMGLRPTQVDTVSANQPRTHVYQELTEGVGAAKVCHTTHTALAPRPSPGWESWFDGTLLASWLGVLSHHN